MLNAALYCVDALDAPPGGALGAPLEAALDELETWLGTVEGRRARPSAMGTPFEGAVAHWREERDACGVLLISPNPFSLLSSAVWEILASLGVPVRGLIVRKFTLARFRQELRRDGPLRLFRKIHRKLVLRADENPERTAASLQATCARLGAAKGDLRVRARRAGCAVIEVDALEEAAPAVRALGAELAIFTGGGMARAPILDALPKGILNVHMGGLPRYKGMDVVQAPILEGCFDDIALTAHLMEPRLDRGPVLRRFAASSDGYPSLGALRNELSTVAPILAVDAALGRLSGRLALNAQPEAGRQYYFVHHRLAAMIERVLRRRADRCAATRVEAVVDRFFATYVKVVPERRAVA